MVRAVAPTIAMMREAQPSRVIWFDTADEGFDILRFVVENPVTV